MTSSEELIDDILGRDFTIECSTISLRLQDGAYLFSGPGVISGKISGPFTVTVHDSMPKKSDEFIELVKMAHRGAMMCFDATDYHNREWTGGWLNPVIYGPSIHRQLVQGTYPQLSVDLPVTHFDRFRNSTVVYYSSSLRLPMMEVANIEKSRGDQIEQRSTHWDRTCLELDGAAVTIEETADEDRISLAIAHTDTFGPPYCEIALPEAIGFVCATPLRPRIAVRYLKEKKLLFVRETNIRQIGLPRPIAYHGPRDADFWKLFLAFLSYCKANQQFEIPPLARLFSELVYASSGTIHVLILSLAVAVDDLVAQIVGESPRIEGIEELKQHIRAWDGATELKDSAIALISSLLTRRSTRQHLRDLVSKGVVTKEQCEVWDSLRPKVAHGKVAEYDEKIWPKRQQLLTMVYRLIARLLKYRGTLTDYTQPLPVEYHFDWGE